MQLMLQLKPQVHKFKNLFKQISGLVFPDKNPHTPSTTTTTTKDGKSETSTSINYAVGGAAGTGATVITNAANTLTITTKWAADEQELVDSVALE